MTKRCLVLTYEFPPAGGGGVQRVAKFCRFLPQNGWEPHVVTATLIPGRPTDDSLVSDVAGVAVRRTPHRHVATAVSRAIAPLKGAMKRGSGPGSGAEQPAAPSADLAKPSLSSRIARWVATPDDAVLWKGPAVRAAYAIGKAQQVDVVIASGPPYSVLVAGEKVAKLLGVPFVADMRDGWSTSPVLSLPTPLHRAFSKSLEKRVMRRTAAVTCATPAIAEEARSWGAHGIEVLPNGFDDEDLPVHAPDASAPLHLAFMGKMFFGHSDPTTVFEAFAKLSGVAADARLTIVGAWPEQVEQMAASLGIADRVTFQPYLPHREALELVASADVGLVIVADRPGAEGTTPGKLYEYLGIGLPVLFVGPSRGFAVELIGSTHSGVCVSPGDVDAIASAITAFTEHKRAGTPLAHTDADQVARYSRRGQAAMLADILDRVSAKA